MTTAIGEMTMPADFAYKNVYLRGRPQHKKFDSFWRKHPPMDPGHWAKIFAPFDALEGFDEGIRNKELQYCERKELSEDELEDLNRKLRVLHELTGNSRLARENNPHVTITYFSPCTDPHSDWYGRGGQYRTIEGMACRRVGTETITLNAQTIPLQNITRIILVPDTSEEKTCGKNPEM